MDVFSSFMWFTGIWSALLAIYLLFLGFECLFSQFSSLVVVMF